jgi:hypothetical protein
MKTWSPSVVAALIAISGTVVAQPASAAAKPTLHERLGSWWSGSPMAPLH